jgi:hypothetical protein
MFKNVQDAKRVYLEQCQYAAEKHIIQILAEVEKSAMNTCTSCIHKFEQGFSLDTIEVITQRLEDDGFTVELIEQNHCHSLEIYGWSEIKNT